MMVVSARPDALEDYRDRLMPCEQSMASRAPSLFGVLETYRRNNPDHAGNHSHLAEQLDHHARRSMDVSMFAGMVATAVRNADGATFSGDIAYVPTSAFDVAFASQTIEGISEDGIVDLRARLVELSSAEWMMLVYGVPHCPDGFAGRYLGQGGITGPDGRIYPLVIPVVGQAEESVHVAFSALPHRDPTTLNGTDPGWEPLTIEMGVGQVQDPIGGFDKAMAGFGMATNPNIRSHNWASPELLASLRIDERGIPALYQPLTPRQPGEFAGFRVEEQPRKVTIQVDGELVEVDPDRMDEQSRKVRRAYDRQQGGASSNAGAPLRSQQTVSRVGNALDLAVGGLQALQSVRDIDNATLARYQLHFEIHGDGRRRARLQVFRVADQGRELSVFANNGHVDDGGDLALTPLRYDTESGPQIGPATERHDEPPGKPIQLFNHRIHPLPPDQAQP